MNFEMNRLNVPALVANTVSNHQTTLVLFMDVQTRASPITFFIYNV